MNEISEKIAQLIMTSLTRKLSVEEEACLQEWLLDSSENQKEAARLKELLADYMLVQRYQEIDVQQAWANINKKMRLKLKRERPMALRWLRVAAAIILPLIIVGTLFFYFRSDSYVFENIKPGSSKALLELSSGEKIWLLNDKVETIVNRYGVEVAKNRVHTLVCQTVESPSDEMNTFVVPLGGEYKLVLSDGTKISVNSGSKIKYPNAFRANERLIELEGEAFFEVTKDAKRPFVVKTRNSSIRVLGTKFNVCSYADDDFEHVTLEEGLVEVTSDSQHYRLVPNTQFMWQTDGESSVTELESRLYTSWKDGIFRFQNMKLEDLAKKINRWYNVRIRFKDENCKYYRFTGAIEKNMNFGDFIKIIGSTTGVQFVMKENEIEVSKK